MPARDRVEVRLADEVDADYAAALVELAGGAVSVEQRVDGPHGADVSPCTTQAADSWYFADGRTTADAMETLAFFNPFPDPAVVDVTFRTEEDLRTPVEFEAYAVPAQSLVVEDIGTLVTRREHVSVSVEARSGRLVVSRLLDIDGSEGPRGLDIAAGAPRPATTWYFPDGIVAEGQRETYTVYNPGDTAAEVDLYIEPDEVDRFGAIEPFGLTIPPEGFQEVAVQDEERIGTAIGAGGGEDPVLRHGARVVSVNDVPVVVERNLEGDDGTNRPGFDLMFGAPLLMEQAVLAASSTDESVVIANPVGEHAGAGHHPLAGRGTLGESPTATDLEVPAAGRLVAGHGDPGPRPGRGPGHRGRRPGHHRTTGGHRGSRGFLGGHRRAPGRDRLRAALALRLMARLVLAVALAAAVALLAAWLQRRRPGAAPVVERHHVPTAVARADFARPDSRVAGRGLHLGHVRHLRRHLGGGPPARLAVGGRSGGGSDRRARLARALRHRRRTHDGHL